MRPTRKTEGRERCCLSPASRSGAVTRRSLHHHHCLQTAIYFFFPPLLYEHKPVGRLLQNRRGFVFLSPPRVRKIQKDNGNKNANSVTSVAAATRRRLDRRPSSAGISELLFVASCKAKWDKSPPRGPPVMSCRDLPQPAHFAFCGGTGKNKKPLTPALVKHELSVAAAAPRWA